MTFCKPIKKDAIVINFHSQDVTEDCSLLKVYGKSFSQRPDHHMVIWKSWRQSWTSLKDLARFLKPRFVPSRTQKNVVTAWRNRHICTKFQGDRHIFGSTKKNFFENTYLWNWWNVSVWNWWPLTYELTKCLSKIASLSNGMDKTSQRMPP